ncbi:MAG: TVP38/TMEM64 family protein [Propionibacteriaceae bacterium]|nr:TVP38/TMEM64 family protein [Propionibacteriaceae bacterium]
MVWLAFNVRLPSLDVLRAQIEAFGWWSWLVFLGAYALVALTPIPVTLMALTGGVLFGIVEGSILSILGSMLGSMGGYWIARALGKETVLRLLGSRRETIEERLGSAGFDGIFMLRVMPGLPYWPVNYGAGALGVPSRMFAVASAIASIPGQVSLVAIGAFAARPGVTVGIVVVIAWAVVITLTVWAWRAWKGTASKPLPGSGSGSPDSAE